MNDLGQARLSVVDKYLATYATPEAHIGKTLTACYSHVVAIPCVDERVELIDGIAAAAAAAPGRVLGIIVVNRAATADDSVPRANRELMAQLRAMHRGNQDNIELSHSPPAWLCELDALDVLVVDRTSDGYHFPEGQGVGLARRIGCDIALVLRARGKVASHWIHMTDADVALPIDYFRAADQLHGAALVYPFWHVVDDSHQGRALALYDLSLRYYVLGLRWAGSAYAFHTVGSTIAVDHKAYAAVRGMPRRQAAEDFYLLNKIAKYGAVVRPSIAPIRIEQRTSKRVPFGTGAATERITSALRAGQPFCLYAPYTFVLLRELLSALSDASVGRTLRLNPEIEPLARSLGVIDAVTSARAQTTTSTAMHRRLLEWLDAFRTLKLVHALRDTLFPVAPWRTAIAEAPFLAGSCETGDSVAHVRKRLFELEESTATANPEERIR